MCMYSVILQLGETAPDRHFRERLSVAPEFSFSLIDSFPRSVIDGSHFHLKEASLTAARWLYRSPSFSIGVDR